MLPSPYALRLSNRYSNTREDYLGYVIENGVATDEERAEYREFRRQAVLDSWNTHSAAIDAQRAEAAQHALDMIAFHQRQVLRLRRLGEYDYAAKREEYVLFLERRHRDGDVNLHYMDPYQFFAYRSVRGWGDEELRLANP